MHLIIEEYIIQGKEIKKKLRLVHIEILDTKLLSVLQMYNECL
jgi:hypothetical protein